jgi:REP element-mobilizing transposase RayT
MPNHVHLLLGEPKKSILSTVMQMLKQRVSKKLRKLERTEESHPHPAKKPRGFGMTWWV